MVKKIGYLFAALLILGISAGNAFAAKKFIPKKTAIRYGISRGIPAIVRYQPNHLGINLSFSNFNGLDSVSYSFTYNTNGIAQGVGGTITNSNDPTAVRELLFGTCSRGACRYHYNLSDAHLVLTANYSNGGSAVKRYRIKTYQ